jgi:hypothetical protein
LAPNGYGRRIQMAPTNHQWRQPTNHQCRHWRRPISDGVLGITTVLAIMQVLQKKFSGNNLLNVGLFLEGKGVSLFRILLRRRE